MTTTLEPSAGTLLDELPELATAVERLVEGLTPERIIAFGSTVHGPGHPDSDLDLLVVAESDERMHRRNVRARRALGSIGRSVDVFVYTPAEFEPYRQRIADLASIADGEGVTVYRNAPSR